MVNGFGGLAEKVLGVKGGFRFVIGFLGLIGVFLWGFSWFWIKELGYLSKDF